MTKIEKIKTIEGQIEKWTANDGGLTAAANDALHHCFEAIRFITNPVGDWCEDQNCCNCHLLAIEQDICDIVRF